MDSANNRMARTPSSSAHSPSYGGSDVSIYQNNPHAGKSVDSLVGIPHMGLQDSAASATTIRQGLSVQVEELTKTINYCRKILISSSLPHRNLKP